MNVAFVSTNVTLIFGSKRLSCRAQVAPAKPPPMMTDLGSPLRYRGCTDDRSGSRRRDRLDKIPSIELPDTHGVDGDLLPLRLVPFRDGIDFQCRKNPWRSDP